MAAAPAPQNEKIVVLGLGYVGLPVAVALARAGFDVAGFDISSRRVASLAAGWLLYVLVETPFMRLRARWDAALSPAPAPALR